MAAEDPKTDQDLEELKTKVERLQTALEAAQAENAIELNRLTREVQLSKDVATAMKEQASAQYDLAIQQAKMPFAELAGIKAGIGDMQLPAGKGGTVQIAAGTAGTALLRSKAPLLEVLASLADELVGQLPKGAVLVSEEQLDQAYQAEFLRGRLEVQIDLLKKATKRAEDGSRRPVPGVQILGGGGVHAFLDPGTAVAAAYSVGLGLDIANSFSKLFRVDRKVDVFGADEEAVQILCHLLEDREDKKGLFVVIPTHGRREMLEQARALMDQLDNLSAAIRAADDLLARLEPKPKAEGKTETQGSPQPRPDLDDLKTQLGLARSYMDGLSIIKQPQAFWAQVMGQVTYQLLDEKPRLLLSAKAQVPQITESRALFRSDSVKATAEVQLHYRIMNPDGTIKASHVRIAASQLREVKLDEGLAVSSHIVKQVARLAHKPGANAAPVPAR